MALGFDFSLGVIEQYFSVGARRKLEVSLFQKLCVAAIAVAFLVIVGLSLGRSHENVASNRQQVVVGSKDFTESILLAEIFAQMLEARNAKVERQFELGGNLPHEALVSGRIDLYPEYTGTSYTAIFHHQPITDPRAVYDQLKKEYAEQFKVEVSPPLGFENTFAILVRGAEARRLNLKTISDAVGYAKQWRAGFGPDFIPRADGYPGLAKAYGLKFASEPRDMDLSLTYIALASGKVDLIAGNSTEGRIAALDLFQLADDKKYFPPYEAVYLVREQTVEQVPAVKEVLSKLAGAISTEDMRRMNYEVDANKRTPAEVAREWLQHKGW
jgi:glycine betaine/choline ABC-type transport system substrate-binding protein